jgi:hypothetical protein
MAWVDVAKAKVAKVKATAMAGVFCLDSLWVKLQN